MTASEKTALAAFFDTARAYLSFGYRTPRPAVAFTGGPTAIQTQAALTAHTADSVAAAPGEAPEAALEHIAAAVASCRKCGLCKQRKHPAPGEGALRPLVMVIGEAPGADEDAQGRPFVGPAGKLLDKMLASIDLSRGTNTFIANILKCRPPNNRDPEPEERAACIPYLESQIAVLRPQAILCAGRVAAQTLLKTTATMGALRGGLQWEYTLEKDGQTLAIPLFATYHPSALLRNEGWKRPSWEDLKAFRKFLDSAAHGMEHFPQK
jgi:DNA polymerase